MKRQQVVFLFLFHFIFLITIQLSAQNVGIGTTTPRARLHILDSAVLFSAAGDTLVNPGNVPISGAGRRMMWYADKAAFRTGYVVDFNWDKDSIGIYSFASGYNSKAKGRLATAMGASNALGLASTAFGVSTASGQQSTAMGAGIATGNYATAMGILSKASGNGSTAMGGSTASGIYSTSTGIATATGDYSTALSASTTNGGWAAATGASIASGDYSTALGASTTTGHYSVAGGLLSMASGYISTAFCNSTASGDYSTAMGLNNKAKGYSSTVMGMFNDSILTSNELSVSPTTPMLMVGNGNDNTSRSNAMTILKNGRTGIGTSSPSGRLHVADSSVVFSATGDIPVSAGNTPISGPGRRFMWYPDKAAFRAGYVSTTYWDRDSIGLYSFGVGSNTTARGDYSLAFGYVTTSKGNNSMAGGIGSVALGQSSVAIGNTSAAYANYSVALGSNTVAKAVGSFSVGVSNDVLDFADPVVPATQDRIFQVGNGTDFSRSNALTILRNGNAGLGTTVPFAKLHVAEGNVVFSSNGDITFPVNNPPVNGPGRRMLWYADNASFRVGYVDGNQWDKASTGRYSFAAGYNAMANGDLGSVALGFYPTASGVVATALGNSTVASGHSSTAIGHSSIASGLSSTAMGYASIANGDYSTATGNGTMARGYGSTAIGLGTRAKSYGSLSIGMNNDTTDNPNTIVSAASDRIFQIGSGDVIANTRKNAMTVLRNGNVGIGQLNPIAPLSFNSSTGEKIVFYGDGEPNYGIGIQPNVMQFHTPYPVTSMVFGTGSSSSFTEYVRINGIGQVGIGTSTPQAQLEVNGFTKLGSSSPKIQIKKLTGVTSSIQGNSINVAHGLDPTKIISVTVLVEWQSNSFLHEGYRFSSGYEFSFFTNDTNIFIGNVSGNSANILSKPFKVLITYEE